MTLLTTLGIASFCFVAVFTFRAYRAAPGVGQSPRSAIIEAWLNICIGFTINYVANLLFLPLIGAHVSMADNFWLGWIYTTVSIVRQYVIRRWFNSRLHSAAQRLAGRG